MTGIDLSGIAAVIENLVLLDTIRISRHAAGEPVFNQDTGEYTYPVAEVVYEGPGAVQVASSPGGVTSVPVPNQPWSDETTSRYRSLTPLSAPVAERDMLVTVVQVHAGGDLALLDRQWRVQDPGVAGTLSAVRITVLDQVQQAREGTP